MDNSNKTTFNALLNAPRTRIDAPVQALEKWHPEIHAANDTDESTINIYDIIGEDWDGSGMTAKIVSSVLRKNKGRAVTVNINSPGGDFFEGLAIYNLLKEHDGDVNVRVVGLAASAASVITMAGSNIQIAEAGFLMIHNAWTFAMGNKNAMREVADTLAKFDASMASLYAKQTGIDKAKIEKMLDAETWLSGAEAIKMGFANSLLDSDNLAVDASDNSGYNSSLRRVDIALAKAGVSRSERRTLIMDLTTEGTPGATENHTESEHTTPGAGDSLEAGLQEILTKLKS